jgi:hypothetical protein
LIGAGRGKRDGNPVPLRQPEAGPPQPPAAGLIRDDVNGLAVRGELWAVNPGCLLELDDFEGGEGQWVRGPVAVPGREGVEAYFWTGPVPPFALSGDRWPFDPRRH